VITHILLDFDREIFKPLSLDMGSMSIAQFIYRRVKKMEESGD